MNKANESSIVFSPLHTHNEKQTLHRGASHLDRQDNDQEDFCPPQFLHAKWVNIYFVFLVNNAFKKGRQCFLLSFFDYCLQLFSNAFANYFKNFLGIHTRQSHLDVVQTSNHKRGVKKKFKVTCSLVSFQMEEKRNSSELLCEKLWTYLFLLSHFLF